MALSHGMNIEAVRTLGTQLQQNHAQAIRDLAQQINAMVEQTSATWSGPDAEQFRGWWPEKRSALNAMAEDLHGFGQAALNNATEQEQVSGR